MGLRLSELRVALPDLPYRRRRLRRDEARDDDGALGPAVSSADGRRHAREAPHPEGDQGLHLATAEDRLGQRPGRGLVPRGGRREARVHHRDHLAAARVHVDEVEIALSRPQLHRPAEPALLFGSQ
jgi:hypothetical protein